MSTDVAPPTLSRLPSELQCLVVNFVRRKSDLANVCLTEKSLYAAAKPVLYHTVSINLNVTRYPELSSFFTAGNAGTHQKEIVSSFIPPWCYDSTPHYFSQWRMLTILLVACMA